MRPNDSRKTFVKRRDGEEASLADDNTPDPQNGAYRVSIQRLITLLAIKCDSVTGEGTGRLKGVSESTKNGRPSPSRSLVVVEMLSRHYQEQV
jgi:hypothetical protein